MTYSAGLEAAPDLLLSHPLSADTPSYGNGPTFQRETSTSIANGSTANSQKWILPNHIGTHIDCPRHFYDDGAAIDSYAVAAWWFRRPFLVDVGVEPDSLITSSDIHAVVPPDTDLLLLRTGFESRRGTDDYWERNPGLSAELAHWTRTSLPELRAVGLDAISVTARSHREQGRAAHRAFLAESASRMPVLLVEDMALASIRAPLAVVCVAPMLVRGADGAPCTVFAWTAKSPQRS